jgi:hypothetical protein
MPRVLLFAFLMLALAPATAGAAAREQDPDTWATVNVCDTAKQPDAIGIRASMPGVPKGARLSMRFRVQYRTASGGWDNVEDADSGWRSIGTARGVPAEYGWSFTFAKRTTPVTLRGVVKFRTRRGNTLPREQEAVTEAGHPSKAGSDPAGYSAATCELGKD